MGTQLITFTENIKDNMEIAKFIASSGAIPIAYRGKAADILVAAQHGAEVGLSPLQSLQNIAMINGQPTIWGDALIGIVKASGFCEYVRETFDEDTMTATCITKRVDEPEPVTRTFSIKDAQQAGLWDQRPEVYSQKYKKNIPNPSPWFCYPKRMLQMRARGFCLRDTYPDALKGLRLREEVEDYPEIREVNPAPETPTSETPATQTESIKNKIKPQTAAEEPQEAIEGEVVEMTAKDKAALKGKITRAKSELELFDLQGECAAFNGTEFETEIRQHWQNKRNELRTENPME